jgi:acyl-coenzyme A synthetase/AMP-(fatty) acid ligase
MAVANDDPDQRRYVYTAALSTSTYWDSSNPGHMTGQGYFAAGAMSANTFLYGSGRAMV